MFLLIFYFLLFLFLATHPDDLPSDPLVARPREELGAPLQPVKADSEMHCLAVTVTSWQVCVNTGGKTTRHSDMNAEKTKTNPTSILGKILGLGFFCCSGGNEAVTKHLTRGVRYVMLE